MECDWRLDSGASVRQAQSEDLDRRCLATSSTLRPMQNGAGTESRYQTEDARTGFETVNDEDNDDDNEHKDGGHLDDDGDDDDNDGDDDDDDDDDDDSEENNDEDDLWGTGGVEEPMSGSHNNIGTSGSMSHSAYNNNDLDSAPIYFQVQCQKEPASHSQHLYINDILAGPESHLDNFPSVPVHRHAASGSAAFAALPSKATLVDDFVKASQKMKKKYLTQRFMFSVNEQRVQNQLRKRFAKPRPKTSKNGAIVFFIMTLEAAFALRRLLRIERCYQKELLQPLPNRISQRIKMVLFSMRRANLFLGEVSFSCLNNDEFAFMIPSGICTNAFDGSSRSIHHYTEGCYSQVPLLFRTDDLPYSVTDYASAGSVLSVNKDDLVYILDDRHEQTDTGVEDPSVCHWYFAFQPSGLHSGLILRLNDDRWLPIRARFGWIPSACIDVNLPISMQYSVTTLKFRLETPRISVKSDGTCVTR